MFRELLFLFRLLLLFFFFGKNRFAGFLPSVCVCVASIRFRLIEKYRIVDRKCYEVVANRRFVFGDFVFLDLDSPRSNAEESSNATSERPANSVSSEDDYELLNYRRERSEDKNESFREAHKKEEVVVSEPIYTMVIKSPRPLVAVNVEPEKDDKCQQTNGDIQVDEPDRMEVKANPIPAEEEPVMERDAGDGQTESPIMWEYKLPAPPTPFQDSIQSPLDKLQIASETESRRSSMSTDSLQDNRSAEEEDFVKDSPRSSIDSQEEEPLSPQVLPKISIKEDCDTNQDAIKLHLGVELLGESATEESVLICPAIEEVKVVEEKVVVLQSSDPEAKPYGVESTTDEPLSLELSSLPPVPSTLPPCDSDDDSLTTPDMRFSIATYTVRVNKDSTYEKKLARSSSPDQLTKEMIKPGKLFHLTFFHFKYMKIKRVCCFRFC